MILNGKEIRVILGAITVFQDIPLSYAVKRELSESEDILLSSLFDRIMTLTEEEYQKYEIKNDNFSIDIEKRLSITLDFSLSKKEFQIIQEAIDICISESEIRKDNSINDYFNGDQYGIVIDDFRQLGNRLTVDDRCRR